MIKEILILQKNINFEIKTVVKPKDESDEFKLCNNEAYSGPGTLINSEFLNGLSVPDESISETIKILEKKKKGKKKQIID